MLEESKSRARGFSMYQQYVDWKEGRKWNVSVQYS